MPNANRVRRHALPIAALALSITAATALAQSGEGTRSPRATRAMAEALEWRDCTGGDPGRRVSACSRVLEAGGESPANQAVALRNRGNAHRILGNPAAALADLTRAIEADRRSAGAFAERSALLLEMGEPDRAEEDIEEALALAPRDVAVLIVLASVLDAQGRTIAALAAIDEAIAIAPREARAHASRAHLTIRAGQPDNALADAEAAVRLAPDDVWAIEVRGLVHRLRRESALAKADFDRLVALAPRSPHGYLQRAGALVDLRQLPAAIADYNAALALQPRAAAALSGRAWARLLAGDPAAAVVDASAAIYVDERLAAAWDTRGQARLALGDAIGAARDFDAALSRDDALRGALVGRAKLRLSSRDVAGARADLEKAIALPAGGIDDREAEEEALRLLQETRGWLGPVAEPPGGGTREAAAPTPPAAVVPTPFALTLQRTIEPPGWVSTATATECRLVAQWPDRTIELFARAGLLGEAPGLQIGIGLEAEASRPIGAERLAVRLADSTGSARPIDLDARVLDAAAHMRQRISIGPLQLDTMRRDVERRDSVVVELAGAQLVYPLGDIPFWLPALEQCARALPREVVGRK